MTPDGSSGPVAWRSGARNAVCCQAASVAVNRSGGFTRGWGSSRRWIAGSVRQSLRRITGSGFARRQGHMSSPRLVDPRVEAADLGDVPLPVAVFEVEDGVEFPVE